MAATTQIRQPFNSQNEVPDADPIVQQMDEPIGGDPIVQQRGELQSPGDEENLQQRVVELDNHSASVDEDTTSQVVSTAVERNPSVPLIQPTWWKMKRGVMVVMLLYMKQLFSSPNFRGGNKGESKNVVGD